MANPQYKAIGSTINALNDCLEGKINKETALKTAENLHIGIDFCDSWLNNYDALHNKGTPKFVVANPLFEPIIHNFKNNKFCSEDVSILLSGMANEIRYHKKNLVMAYNKVLYHRPMDVDHKHRIDAAKKYFGKIQGLYEAGAYSIK